MSGIMGEYSIVSAVKWLSRKQVTQRQRRYIDSILYPVHQPDLQSNVKVGHRVIHVRYPE